MSNTRVNPFYAAAERTARLSKSSTCTTERRKTYREEREAAKQGFIGREGFGDVSKSTDSKRQRQVFLLIIVPWPGQQEDLYTPGSPVSLKPHSPIKGILH
jgi:hypothetical protein